MTGKEFQAIRHKRSLSTADIAWLLGVSRRTVEDWEQGRRRVPAAAVLALTGACPTCGRTATPSAQR